jgi:hypothetical protein
MSATAIFAAGVGGKVAGAAFENAFKMLADLPKGESLVGYAQAGSVEPTCLVDEDLRNNDMLPDTLQLAQSVFGAYYLRAFSMHNISIGNASVSQRLDKFATRRSPSSSLVSSIARIGMEEFDERLVVDGEVRELPDDIKSLEEEVLKDAKVVALAQAAMESAPSPYTVKGQQPQGKNTPQSTYSVGMNPDAFKNASDNLGNSNAQTAFSKSVDVNEPVNLGAGRMINVTIKDNGREVCVPVLIRMNAFYMAPQPLTHILSAGSEDISFGARFKKWRHGGIDFWRDVVFCQDLIDAHKNNLKQDKTGIYLQMMQKRAKNGIAAALSGSLSANNASNIIVMSQATADALEMKIFGKLKDFNTRQKLFQAGYGMLMFVIDPRWGRVRMYTRDIPEYTELSERDLKGANKGGGVDIGDVLTSFRAGQSARF